MPGTTLDRQRGSSRQAIHLAAAVAVTNSQCAAAHGLKPLARLHTCVVVGDDPVVMLPGRASRIVPGCAGSRRHPAGLSMADATVQELSA